MRASTSSEPGTTGTLLAATVAAGGNAPPLVLLDRLSVEFPTAEESLVAVDQVSLALAHGERLGIVGESGSGKTVTVSAVMGLLPETASVSGRALFAGQDVLAMSSEQLRSIRGREVALVPQDPTAALSPVRRVGTQMVETLRAHRRLSTAEARRQSLDALAAVKVPAPARQMEAYPFELSGGMLQRVCIAMALLGEPQLLIADEATTALDVSVQASILELLAQVASERSMGLIVVSHDMSVIAGLCERTAVMYAGRVVESGPTQQLFASPHHPYTAALVECRPRLEPQARRRLLASIPGQLESSVSRDACVFAPRCRFRVERCLEQRPLLEEVAPRHAAACWLASRSDEFRLQRGELRALPGPAGATEITGSGALLVAEEMSVQYSVRVPGAFRPVKVTAVDAVDLTVKAGATLGVVGESGCGKSTVGRALLHLQPISGGRVRFEGEDLARLDKSALRSLRRRMQLVVQSSVSSFDPRATLGEALLEAVRLDRAGRSDATRRVRDLLDLVELPRRVAGALPAEVSGGQRQRASIARALATRPALIVADEPTSALDVSVRAGILNLLRRLQTDEGISFVFISHDLAAVRSMSDELVVMYFGHVVESGPADAVFEQPAHPYTWALLAALPGEGATIPRPIPGEVPSLLDPPSGCPFSPRCPRATPECRETMPPLVSVAGRHAVACIHPILGAGREPVTYSDEDAGS
jgi:peptide/nickel transport system ATP-binding protein